MGQQGVASRQSAQGHLMIKGIKVVPAGPGAPQAHGLGPTHNGE
jgi:hypothetical protein